MTLISLLFYVFAGMTGVSALMIFLIKNILYGALLLLVALLGIAGIYVLAGADFLAGTQIVVYVGGVLILLMFGIMLTHKSTHLQPLENTAPQSERKNSLLAIIVGLLLFSFLVYTIHQANFSELPWIKNATIDKSSKVSSIGISFMTHYLIAFELIAIILLLALIGATRIASEKS